MDVSDGAKLHGGGAYQIKSTSLLVTLPTAATAAVTLAQLGMAATMVTLGVVARCIKGTYSAGPTPVATYSVGDAVSATRFANAAALTANTVAATRAIVPTPSLNLLITPSATPIDTDGKLLLTVFYAELVAPAGN